MNLHFCQTVFLSPSRLNYSFTLFRHLEPLAALAYWIILCAAGVSRKAKRNPTRTEIIIINNNNERMDDAEYVYSIFAGRFSLKMKRTHVCARRERLCWVRTQSYSPVCQLWWISSTSCGLTKSFSISGTRLLSHWIKSAPRTHSQTFAVKPMMMMMGPSGGTHASFACFEYIYKYRFAIACISLNVHNSSRFALKLRYTHLDENENKLQRTAQRSGWDVSNGE